MSEPRLSGRGGRVVVVDGARLASMEDWRTAAKIAALAASAGGRPAGLLLDCRSAGFVPSMWDADGLASMMSVYPLVALVSTGGAQYGCTRMLCTLLDLRGSDAAVFPDVAKARDWLSDRLGVDLDGPAAQRGLAP